MVLVLLIPTLGLGLTSTTTYKPNRVLNLNYISPQLGANTISNLRFNYQLEKIQAGTPISVAKSHINMKRSQQMNIRNIKYNT